MFQTKSLTMKEALAEKRGYRRTDNQTTKLDLRTIVTEKTRRYHQNLKNFSIKQSLIVFPKEMPVNKRKQNEKDGLQVRQFKTDMSYERMSENSLSKPIFEESSNEEGSLNEFTLGQNYKCCTKQTDKDELLLQLNQIEDEKENKQNNAIQEKEIKNKKIQKYQSKISQLQLQNQQLKKQNEQFLNIIKNYKKSKTKCQITSSINLQFENKAKNEIALQTDLSSDKILSIIEEREKIVQFFNSFTQNINEEQQLLISIQKTIKNRLQTEIKPYLLEIQELKQKVEKNQKGYEQKIKIYGNLLKEAQKQIEKLLMKLRKANQQSIETFKVHLNQERQLIGMKVTNDNLEE